MRFKEEIETEYFQKDFSKLLRKYRTLIEDFNNFKNFSLEPFLLDNINNKCSERISNLGIKYSEIWYDKLTTNTKEYISFFNSVYRNQKIF